MERALRGVPGIVAVHDVHCWTITTGFVAFTAHLQVVPGHDPQRVIEEAAQLLEERYGIGHTTLQPEMVEVLQPVEARE